MRLLALATIFAAATVAALTLYAVPLAPSLGDCYGNVFNEDPLHCYVLEQAESRNVLDIEKIYDANGRLHISLRQEQVPDSEAYEFIKARSREFYDLWPNLVPRLDFYNNCIWQELKPTYKECYLEIGLGPTGLPKAKGHEGIEFHTGGETARREQPGWASWRQVYPRGIGGVDDGIPSSFDIGDVDTSLDSTNMYCPEKVRPEDVYLGNICSRNHNVQHSIAGSHGMYVQYKNPPTDDVALHAIKKAMDPCYDKIGECTWYATTTKTLLVDGVEEEVTERIELQSPDRTETKDIIIVPVKYSLVELLHWSDVLNRFALSRGNVIGIERADVERNTRKHFDYKPLWPLDTLKQAEDKKNGYGPDPSQIRSTIMIWATDGPRAAEALLTLLPQLGIPVDAVGIVLTSIKGTNGYGWDDISRLHRPGPPPPGFMSKLDNHRPIVILTRNVGLVLAISALLFIITYVRRRS